MTPRGNIGNDIFGGHNAGWAKADVPKMRLDPDKMLVAGVKLASDEERPTTARNDPNKSSIEGGIFGRSGPAHAAAGSRADPNRSSIPGGIFG